MMMSRKYWVITAAFTLASSGMAQGTMKHDMMQGTMKRDMGAMPSLASMIQRADSLVGRTEKMMRATTDTTAHAMMMRRTTDTTAHAMMMRKTADTTAHAKMMMDRAAGDSPPAMASNLHAMTTGLRGVLRHMEAMHRAGMKMEGDAATVMMDMHRRMNTVLGELEKTAQAMETMHMQHMKGSP